MGYSYVSVRVIILGEERRTISRGKDFLVLLGLGHKSSSFYCLLPSLRRILLPLVRFLCDVSSSSLPRRGTPLGISVPKRADTRREEKKKSTLLHSV